MKKVLHADMHLSARSNDCWSARIHSAMDGLTQSYIFKQKLQICEPIDLSCFVIDLRERHLILKLIQENTTASALLITNGVLFLQEGLWSLIRLTSFPNTCCSTCLVMSFTVKLVSDFVFTPCVLRQRRVIKAIPPPVTYVILMLIQDEQHVLFHCAFVTVWHVSEQIQAIWLKCAGQVFNVPGNVALGAVYLIPKTDKRSNSDITESFEHFFDEATTASLNFTNVLMMGDFNAHIGDLSEFTDEHYDIQDDFKCLQHARLTCCKSLNRGKLLLDIAAAVQVLTTCSLLVEVRETLVRPHLWGIMAGTEVDLITSS